MAIFLEQNHAVLLPFLRLSLDFESFQPIHSFLIFFISLVLSGSYLGRPRLNTEPVFWGAQTEKTKSKCLFLSKRFSQAVSNVYFYLPSMHKKWVPSPIQVKMSENY